MKMLMRTLVVCGMFMAAGLNTGCDGAKMSPTTGSGGKMKEGDGKMMEGKMKDGDGKMMEGKMKDGDGKMMGGEDNKMKEMKGKDDKK